MNAIVSLDKAEYKKLVSIKNRLEKDLDKTVKDLNKIDSEMNACKEIISDKILTKAINAENKYENIVKYLGVRNERVNHAS